MSRKILFIIVEGESDYDALGVIFDGWFTGNDVQVEIIGGDITSDYMSSSSNIVNYVTEKVKTRMRQLGKALRRSDIERVIHIVDTDGAFVSDSCVCEDRAHRGGPVYTPSQIIANPSSDICGRNRKKKANLLRLSRAATIWKSIPYSVYFMSCNMDHVLHDKQNNPQKNKIKDARAFARRYMNDLKGFASFINAPDIAVEGDYSETWQFISGGTHSLERHTNLGLCFQA